MADGRFAPSPSGPLHLGSLRTALVAWLFARQAGSRFWLRVDDLDPTSSRPEVVAQQLGDLRALGLDWDEPVWRQSERTTQHRDAVDTLIELGLTYPCWCTRREIADAVRAPNQPGPGPEGAYPGTCARLSGPQQAERMSSGRPAALRLRAEGAVVAFADRLHGPVEGTVDDFVVRRNDGVAAYNLAVVVDDAAQGVEEVVRGDDLLDSTPRQIHLARVLDLAVPSHAHVPLVLGADGVRLAKRHGAISLDRLARFGHDALAVRTALARSLALAGPEDGDNLSLDVLLDRFDPDALPRAPWVLAPDEDVLTTP